MAAVRKTGKSKAVKNADGSTTYGPYKGSAANHGRPTKVIYNKNASGSKTSTTNAARDEKKKSIGHNLPRSEQVAHKGGKGHQNADGNHATSASSTTVQSMKKNIGTGNQDRASVSRRKKK